MILPSPLSHHIRSAKHWIFVHRTKLASLLAKPRQLTAETGGPASKYLDAEQFNSLLDEEIPQHGQTALGSSPVRSQVSDAELKPTVETASAKKRKRDETDDDKRERLSEALAYLKARNDEWIATNEASGQFSHRDWMEFSRDDSGPLKLKWNDARWVWNNANLTPSYRGVPGR